ncbi:cohesin domain-containing protein [Candidatus Bathyarchaeota archaeon]|nr:cohesin domain-containing protein [Candidatus Bathyarchaeota archaeon]
MSKQLQTLALIGLIVTAIALSGSVMLVSAQHDPEICFDNSLYTAHKVGETFNVTVDLRFVEASLRIVGVQFRVTYDPILVEALNVYEGYFLKQFNNTAAPPDTFFTSSIDDDGIYGPNVLVGILVLPNGTGVWTNFPAGSGALATITFKALYRPMEPSTVTMPLTLVNTLMTDDDMNEISHTIIDASYEPTPITRPTLAISPATYTASLIGETFNTTVTINNVDPDARIVGVQFRVSYDPSLVEAISVSEGSFLSQFNNTAAPPYTYFTSSIDDDGTYGPNVLVGILVLPNATGNWTNFPTGSGALASITFKALYRPMEPDTVTMPLTLVNTLIIDDSLNEVPHVILNATYEPTPITRPTLTVSPATYNASMIGETFNTTIAINNLDPDALSFGQRLVGVMFRVQYDSTLLKPLALYEGPFPKQFNNTESPPYTFLTYSFNDDLVYGSNVLVGILILPNGTGAWTNFPVGSGALATITFEAISQQGEPQPAISSTLTLTDTQLINANLDDIPHTTQSGQYQILPLSFTVEPTDLFAQQRVTLTTQLPAYPITYNWNFGDGTSTIRSEQGSGTGTGTTSVNHIYASPGTYDITLTCTVGDAASGVLTSSATHTAVVQANNQPTIDIVIDSGSVYFRGETAEFSILTTNNGEPIGTTKMAALLYHGSSLSANLTALVQTVTTGLYRVTYSIPADADFGTYTLLAKAEYYNARGTSTKAFQISQTLTTTTATITQIENDVATIQTDLDTIKVNLTAINASISGLIVDAKGTLLAQITSSMGTLTTRLDLINGTITAINGNTVTISTTLGEVSTTLGNVKTKLNDLQTTTTNVQPMIYAATVFSLIAMILAAIILLRGRKK